MTDRAEIEDLSTCSGCDVVWDEVEQLRADVARLTRERDEARAEVSALEAVAEERRARAKRAEADVKRLRAVAEAAERFVSMWLTKGPRDKELRDALAACREGR